MTRRSFSLFTILLLVAGCSSQPPAPDLSPPSFHSKQVIALDVGTIQVKNEYTSPKRREHVESLFTTTPAQGVEIWARDRLRVAGSNERRLEVVIQEASVVESPLHVRKGFKGAFTKEPNRRYDAKLDVTLKIYGSARMLPEAEIHSQANVTRELLEGTNVRDQDALFAAITRELLEQLDAQLSVNIQQYFTRYLVLDAYEG